MNAFSTRLIDTFKPSTDVDLQSLFLEGSLLALFSILGVLALAAIGCDPQALTGSSWALW